MIISIRHEMLVFWAAFLCGQIMGIFFDFFRSIRKNLPHGKILSAAEDAVFCILSFKMFFDMCYVTNNGNLRWYIFASLLCSGIIYFCIFSKYIFLIWNFLFKILIKILMPFIKSVVFLKTKILKTLKKLISYIAKILLKFPKGLSSIVKKTPNTP